MAVVLNWVGLAIGAATLVALLWSVFVPSRRIWPPRRYGRWTPWLVWVPTVTLFGILVFLGVQDWGTVGLPGWLRFGIGAPLIVASNIAVWSEVRGFGWRQTGGDEGRLVTDGLYRFSRNPQYVADALMIVGWLLLSASAVAIPLGLVVIACLLVEPFAEEPWLEERHGEEYAAYRRRTPRFLGL